MPAPAVNSLLGGSERSANQPAGPPDEQETEQVQGQEQETEQGQETEQAKRKKAGSARPGSAFRGRPGRPPFRPQSAPVRPLGLRPSSAAAGQRTRPTSTAATPMATPLEGRPRRIRPLSAKPAQYVGARRAPRKPTAEETAKREAIERDVMAMRGAVRARARVTKKALVSGPLTGPHHDSPCCSVPADVSVRLRLTPRTQRVPPNNQRAERLQVLGFRGLPLGRLLRRRRQRRRRRRTGRRRGQPGRGQRFRSRPSRGLFGEHGRSRLLPASLCTCCLLHPRVHVCELLLSFEGIISGERTTEAHSIC